MSPEPEDIVEIDGGFRFEGEAAEALQALADEMGATPVEALRAALALVRRRLDAEKAG